MATTLCTKATSITPRSPLRRRLPLVGAICVLSLGISNLCSSISYSATSAGGGQFVTLLRSKFGTLASKKSFSTVRMEDSGGGSGSGNTVPCIVVYVTVPNKEAGKKLAESIVKEKLAACVNRVPGVESVYEWKGQIQTDSEELLIIKTRQSLLDALTVHVKENHEYEVPEVIALPITAGNIQYLEWLKNGTRG